MTAADLLACFKNARVLVVGDVMLDRFIHGRVGRISPEAPVPVLTIERQAESLGGAGNVARNIASLGGRATLVGGRGKDEAGARIDALLAKEPLIANALLNADGPTTEKIRYIAGRQQVLRADRERPWQGEAEQVLAEVKRRIGDHDVLVLSDYAKGFVSASLAKEVIALARAHGKPVIVDPKASNFAHYDGASVITPNKQEAMAMTGIETESDAGVEACARRLLKDLPHLSAVMITRGPQGLSLLERNAEVVHVLAKSREVFDVSGAGDTLAAALALALAADGDLKAAAELANVAAGIAVTMVGTAAVTAEDVAGELQARALEGAERKIVSGPQALEWVARWRANSRRIGFTNGCFDLLHPGHIALLREARARCDHLVVGLNADASVKRLKGPDRPLQSETARALVLASLAMVDLVTIFAEDTPEALIRLLKPDVLVKGADYKLADIVGADLVASYGGEVVRVPLVPDESSSRLITKARRC